MGSLFDRKKIIPRYKIIGYLMVLLGIMIVGKALYTATVKRDYWMKVADRLKRDSVDVKPVRGNILSCDGRLMASSLPEFKLYMDFKAGGDEKDSLWNEKVDSICEGLHDIFPEKSAAEFKRDLEEGHKIMSQNWPIWKKRVSYDSMPVNAPSVHWHSVPWVTCSALRIRPGADWNCRSTRFCVESRVSCNAKK